MGSAKHIAHIEAKTMASPSDSNTGNTGVQYEQNVHACNKGASFTNSGEEMEEVQESSSSSTTRSNCSSSSTYVPPSSVIAKEAVQQQEQTIKADNPSSSSPSQNDSPNKQKQKQSLSTTEQKRRERKLAMNRVSARERRKRKRLMMEEMQSSIDDLNSLNAMLRERNALLKTRLEQKLAERFATLPSPPSLLQRGQESVKRESSSSPFTPADPLSSSSSLSSLQIDHRYSRATSAERTFEKKTSMSTSAALTPPTLSATPESAFSGNIPPNFTTRLAKEETDSSSSSIKVTEQDQQKKKKEQATTGELLGADRATLLPSSLPSPSSLPAVEDLLSRYQTQQQQEQQTDLGTILLQQQQSVIPPSESILNRLLLQQQAATSLSIPTDTVVNALQLPYAISPLEQQQQTQYEAIIRSALPAFQGRNALAPSTATVSPSLLQLALSQQQLPQHKTEMPEERGEE